MKYTKNTIQHRWLSIDALRGLAVIFMITQHVTYWVSYGPKARGFVFASGVVGGLAAPIFVTLSGIGIVFLAHRHEHCDRQLVIRGVMIMAFGYLLNFLSPHWFSMGSWFVLHIIGFGLVVSPLLRRIPTPVLLGLFVAIIVGTVLIQYGLHTPFRLNNNDMSIPRKTGGVLRFALAEGFFPVFPWFAFMIAGILAGRWLLDGKQNRLWHFALILLVTLGILTGLHAMGLGFIRNDVLYRFFKFKLSFYPAMTPITLLLISLSLLFLFVFTSLEKKISFRSSHFLVCLGRASLTFLIVHIVVIREGALIFNYWHTLSLIPAMITVLLVLVFFSVFAIWWQKINYKYGAEWVLRKLAR